MVLGETEISYLNSLSVEHRLASLRRFFEFPIPALFITKSQPLPAGLAEVAAGAGVPVFRSPLKTNEFYRRMKPILDLCVSRFNAFARLPFGVTPSTAMLAEHHWLQWWSYQPASRWWQFQLTEGGWLLAASLLLIAGTVLLIRRRPA